MKRVPVVLWGMMLGVLAFTGCARHKDLESLNREQARVIADLNREVGSLQDELERMKFSREELVKAKEELETRLKSELEGGGLSVEMQERGLVVTVLDRVLFDPGKAEIKDSARTTLDKVADVLKSRVPEHLVYVEGHTDNDPIRYSGWRSNWELSTARATEVIHYFVESQGVNPARLIAAGFGEFHPVAANDTLVGKARNRRVEIVITPKKITELIKQALETRHAPSN